MAGIFNIQPQRVAVGSFRSPDGQDVPVYMSQPWYRALEQLSKATVPSGPAGAGISFDAQPAFEYGGTVFPSGANTLQRLAGKKLGDVLYDGGPGAAPFWGALPEIPPPGLPLSSLLCDDQGRLLLDDAGLIFTDA